MTIGKEIPANNVTPETETQENSIIRRISLIGILGNVALSAFKMFAGIVGNSGAMISDAVHSFSDVLATLIAFLGVRLSKQAADKKHPYGHERFECVASLLLGGILLITGFGIGKAGLEKILAGSYETLTAPGTIALVAAVVSIVSKESMYWYTRHYAKNIKLSGVYGGCMAPQVRCFFFNRITDRDCRRYARLPRYGQYSQSCDLSVHRESFL